MVRQDNITEIKLELGATLEMDRIWKGMGLEMLWHPSHDVGHGLFRQQGRDRPPTDNDGCHQ